MSARILPLYTDTTAPIEFAERLALDSECEACSLHKHAFAPCMPAEGGDAPGGLLVVGEGPGREEDREQRPFVGRSGRYLRQQIRQHWNGSISFDNATRCFKSNEKLGPKMINACRGYLARTFEEVQPERVLLLGNVAALSVLGRKLAPYSVRRGYGWLDGFDAYAFTVIHPAAALRNRFVRAWFEADLEWALTANPKPPPLASKVRVAFDEDSILAMIEDLRESGAVSFTGVDAPGWIAFDCETSGAMFGGDFRLVSLSLCAKGTDEAWVVTREALADEGCRVLLRNLLHAARLVAHNFKFDALALRCGLDLVLDEGNIGLDTMLVRKVLNPDAAADLETNAELVGMGGHKEEADRELKKIVRKINKAAKDGAPIIPEGEPPLRYAYGMIPPAILYRYNAADTVATARLGSLLGDRLDGDEDLVRVWDELVRPACWALTEVEAWGIGVDLRAAKVFRNVVEFQIQEHLSRMEAAGIDDPNSVPKLRAILFEKLKLPVIKRTDTGLASTDAEVLEALADKFPLANSILRWRKLSKLQGTYADGVLSHTGPDERIHPNFRIGGARSGRLSCAEPNLQNIPRADTDEGKMARDCFVAPRGRVLLQADYSQLELRIAAMLSGDEKMRAIFDEGLDYHQRTAELVSRTAWGIEPHEVEKKHRSLAKTINFGVLYGEGAPAVAAQVGCSVPEAERVMEAILGEFGTFSRWCQGQLAAARRTGETRTWWRGNLARRRSLYRIADKEDKARSTAERGSWNTPIQGTASDFCLASLVEVVRWVTRENFPAKVVVSVHDSIMLEVDEDRVDEAAARLVTIMRQWPSRRVPLVVDLEVGPAWGSIAPLELDAAKHEDEGLRQPDQQATP